MPWVNLGVIFGEIGAPWAPSKSEITVQDAVAHPMDRVSMDLESFNRRVSLLNTLAVELSVIEGVGA